jgi:hypothetical protein
MYHCINVSTAESMEITVAELAKYGGVKRFWKLQAFKI